MKGGLHTLSLLIGVLAIVFIFNACSSTPRPSLTPTRQPDSIGIVFKADRSYIKVGMCVNFTWEVNGAKAVYFYDGNEAWQDKAVTPSDTRKVCQQKNTTYYLRVIMPDDTLEIRQIKIPVEAMPGL